LELRRSLNFCFAVSLVLICLTSAFAGVITANQDAAERKRAFQLFQDGKYMEALPVFEKLAATTPNDREVIETLGFLVVTQSNYLKDPAARRQSRVRGRVLLARAEQMGANDNFLKYLLATVPENGGDDTTFSTKKEVEEAMRNGEAAFAKGDFDEAVKSYQLALLFDPRQYEAALFTGDVYYKSDRQDKAGEWFQRAVTINPDRETAYRYWGDSLMKQGKMNEARDKFIEAFIAEPYNRLASGGFAQWGQRNNISVAHPKIDIPTSVSPLENGKMTINLDPSVFKGDDKNGAGAAWMVYGMVRATWVTTGFAKEYPNEKVYRHSLKEEAAALRAVVAALANQKKDGETKTLDPSLQNLVKLERSGVLEAYILLARPDQGIAQDFAAYRSANKDKLRRYVVEYVLTGEGK
jgi:tetratricopeptide (TPR) repeat protein